MRVKDLIKELQKFDPETPISGGLYEVECLPAWYDGSCSYINDDGKLVHTRSGHKVCFRFKGDVDIVWDAVNYPASEQPSFERVMENIIIDLPDKDEHIKWIKNEYNEVAAYRNDRDQRYLNEVVEKANRGWKFLQERDHKMKYYDWQILDENGKEQGANAATTCPILFGGKFKRHDYDLTYWEWRLEEVK